MNAFRRTALAATLLTVAATAACDDDPTGVTAVPGSLLVSLETPHTDDGAALVVLTGPGLLSARQASDRHDLFWRVVSSSEIRVIVTGGLSSGPIFSVDVPDIGKSGYSASLVDVAASDDRLRSDLSGYRVVLEATSQ